MLYFIRRIYRATRPAKSEYGQAMLSSSDLLTLPILMALKH